MSLGTDSIYGTRCIHRGDFKSKRIFSIYQKSFGDPNQVKGQIIKATIIIHIQEVKDVEFPTRSKSKSDMRMMKTQAPPYKVAIMHPR